MSSDYIFWWGFGGSLAVEALAWARVYNTKGKIKLPERFRLVGFYVSQFLLAGFAGFLAVAYGIDKPILAINVGVAAPLIIQAFREGVGSRPDEVT